MSDRIDKRITKKQAWELALCRCCIHGNKKGTQCNALNAYYGIPDDECMVIEEVRLRWQAEMKQKK